MGPLGVVLRSINVNDNNQPDCFPKIPPPQAVSLPFTREAMGRLSHASIFSPTLMPSKGEGDFRHLLINVNFFLLKRNFLHLGVLIFLKGINYVENYYN